MTSKALAALNRKTRILQMINLGCKYGEIAAAEHCDPRWVSAVALAAGIRKLPPRVAAPKSPVGVTRSVRGEG